MWCDLIFQYVYTKPFQDRDTVLTPLFKTGPQDSNLFHHTRIAISMIHPGHDPGGGADHCVLSTIVHSSNTTAVTCKDTYSCLTTWANLVQEHVRFISYQPSKLLRKMYTSSVSW